MEQNWCPCWFFDLCSISLINSDGWYWIFEVLLVLSWSNFFRLKAPNMFECWGFSGGWIWLLWFRQFDWEPCISIWLSLFVFGISVCLGRGDGCLKIFRFRVSYAFRRMTHFRMLLVIWNSLFMVLAYFHDSCNSGLFLCHFLVSLSFSALHRSILPSSKMVFSAAASAVTRCLGLKLYGV